MPWESIGELLNMAVFLIGGIFLLTNYKGLARGCVEEKIRTLGAGKADHISEAIARFFLVFMGLVFTVGSVIKIIYILLTSF